MAIVVDSVPAAPSFADRAMDVLNDGMLALMISIGHRTGLFDAMNGAPPLTSAELAERAGLNERYVREWLAAMAVGRIVDYEPASRRFTLPNDRAAVLSRAAGYANVARQMQFVGLLASVEHQVVRTFREGGGVPYSEFGEFHALMAEGSKAKFDGRLIADILPVVPGIVNRLTAGIDVADVGCGSGHAINLLARAFPASRFVGYDFAGEGLAAGRAEAASWALGNATFIEHDAATLEAPAAFDFVTTFDAIHDQARPDLVLAAIRRSLRPDGVYLCVDSRASSLLEENMDEPLGVFLYTASAMHCMTVSLALGGMGLGTAWGRQLALTMLADAGFGGVDVKTVEGDTANYYFVASPG